VSHIASTRSSSLRSLRSRIRHRARSRRAMRQRVSLRRTRDRSLARSFAHARERASEPFVDIARIRGETRLFLLCVFAVRGTVSPCITVTLRASSHPLASRAPDVTFTCQLSLRRPDTRISLCQALSAVRIRERLRARERERERERERVNASTRLRESKVQRYECYPILGRLRHRNTWW